MSKHFLRVKTRFETLQKFHFRFVKCMWLGTLRFYAKNPWSLLYTSILKGVLSLNTVSWNCIYFKNPTLLHSNRLRWHGRLEPSPRRDTPKSEKHVVTAPLPRYEVRLGLSVSGQRRWPLQTDDHICHSWCGTMRNTRCSMSMSAEHRSTFAILHR